MPEIETKMGVCCDCKEFDILYQHKLSKKFYDKRCFNYINNLVRSIRGADDEHVMEDIK